MCGRKDEEWTFRSSMLQAQVLTVLAEIAWSALHPRTLPPGACALAALLHACLQGLHLTLAFGAPQGGYRYGLALPLQLAALLVLIPVTQVGNNDALQRRISPARYKMLGFLAAVVVAVASLLWP
eukprot:CAMPEP_0179168172 /NCGR_PEP_ID=MMETSP0796-20121207/82713_1 /TAXON_ID=73915 /ORGANISM="Pyrodinium bahamense, Strain pbaha01" /LENGTH=124 /DNA_ID=CAMNT_0020870915 /DNA_START=99 /DNA_END=470 /DNA_ORIENTATION=+